MKNRNLMSRASNSATSVLSFFAAAVWLTPAAYVIGDSIYWLGHGKLLSYNLCLSLDLLCPTGKAVGLDKILYWLSENPLLILIVSSGFVAFVLLYIADDMKQMNRLDEEIARSKLNKS